MQLRPPFPRRLPAWALGLPLACVCAQPLHAETSPWYVGTSINYQHDTNVLRLANGAATPDAYFKADDLLSASLLAGMDQPIGRQRVFGNATLSSNHYSRNSQYNNQSYAVSAGLDWATIERLSGSLSYSDNRTLSSFNVQDAGLLPKNMESTQSVGATARWGLLSLLSLDVGANHRRVNDSLDNPSVQARNYTQDSGSVGLSWHPGPATSLGLGLRSTQGRYPQTPTSLTPVTYVTERFKRHDVDLTASLQPSGASVLDLRLSSGKVSYDQNDQRNFSGVTGSLAWNWQATGKLRLSTRLGRDTGQDSSFVRQQNGDTSTANYGRISNSLSTRADYALSTKVNMNFGVTYYDDNYVRTLLDTTDKTGRDRITQVTFGASWQPMRATQVGCNVSTMDQRGTGDLGMNIKSTTYSCYGQLTMQ